MSALFEDVPTRCILDYLETYLYVGLSNGDIHRILVKSLLFELNKTTPEPENSTKALFLGHKYLFLIFENLNLKKILIVKFKAENNKLNAHVG